MSFISFKGFLTELYIFHVLHMCARNIFNWPYYLSMSIYVLVVEYVGYVIWTHNKIRSVKMEISINIFYSSKMTVIIFKQITKFVPLTWKSECANWCKRKNTSLINQLNIIRKFY